MRSYYEFSMLMTLQGIKYARSTLALKAALLLNSMVIRPSAGVLRQSSSTRRENVYTVGNSNQKQRKRIVYDSFSQSFGKFRRSASYLFVTSRTLRKCGGSR